MNNKLRIGIDCRMWNETGVGRYIKNIVLELSKKDSTNQYILFCLKKDFDKINLPANFKKVVADIRWHTFSEQIILPFSFYAQKLDLLHVPHFNVPILYFGKTLTTIHDLTILRTLTGRATTLPYVLYLVKHFAFKLTMYFTIKKSKLIFTVSNFVKQDIVETYKVNPSKILLTPCAVESDFKQRALGDILPVFQKYKVQQPYIFYVGNAHPHKNLERLIKAFQLIVKRFPDMTLVLGGSKRFFYERLEREYLHSPIYQKLNFVGYVDDNDLPALYSGTELFVNPSLYEGFGIQILEAYACGTKVACSNTTSLPEIAATGAYLFDPRDIRNIADTISDALLDTSGHKVEAGYKRVLDFSWEVSASTILSTYENCYSL